MSVLSAESTICIDVFDKDMESIIGSFMKNFSVDVLKGLKFIKEDIYEGKSIEYYELKFPFDTIPDQFGIDGKVCLRFFNTDARTLQFNSIFKRCNDDKLFTYLIVAMSDTHSMSNTLIELKQLLYNKGDSCINTVCVRIYNRSTSKAGYLKISRTLSSRWLGCSFNTVCLYVPCCTVA